MLIQGDCLEKLKELPDNSVDSVITDPPYGLGFMGKEWDNFKPSKIDEAMEKDKRIHTQIASQRRSNTAGTYDLSKRGMFGYQDWYYLIMKECLRVLKPGGHLLSFGGTRTYHRMACAIEDAGFEVRDMIEWVYGSGFPKSLNIGKAVDKLQGNEREWISESPFKASEEAELATQGKCQTGRTTHPDLTKGTSEYEGWGTALKPSHEPICMARKPITEKTIAENVLKYGTGGINIDESRVEYQSEADKANAVPGSQNHNKTSSFVSITTLNKLKDSWEQPQGRFPANLIHDNSEEVRECFPETKTGSIKPYISKDEGMFGMMKGKEHYNSHDGDSGNASRFFKSIAYYPKASKSERNKGCEGLEEKESKKMDGGTFESASTIATERTSKNNHPTVKPIVLMEYLIKMITPKGGVVLDPFMGSGSTGVAAKKNGFSFIGIEKEPEYVKIAEARIKK